MPDLEGKVHGFELAESSYNVKKKKKKTYFLTFRLKFTANDGVL